MRVLFVGQGDFSIYRNTSFNIALLPKIFPYLLIEG